MSWCISLHSYALTQLAVPTIDSRKVLSTRQLFRGFPCFWQWAYHSSVFVPQQNFSLGPPVGGDPQFGNRCTHYTYNSDAGTDNISALSVALLRLLWKGYRKGCRLQVLSSDQNAFFEYQTRSWVKMEMFIKRRARFTLENGNILVWTGSVDW